MKSKAEIYEGIAFNWCKVATILLMMWVVRLDRWALPLAAITSAVLFVVAYALGARESRCIMKRPLLIAGFWTLVAVVWWWLHR